MAGIKLNLKPGKYVLAVSGGVDSMVLLDLLAKQSSVSSRQSLAKTKGASKTDDSGLGTRDSTNSIEFVVAHFNHGIRADSAKDENLVVKTARKYGLKIEVGHGKLGPKVSEDTARQARYAYLQAGVRKHGAKAILTAHHQDDLLETAVINILRGTGRRGLSSIAENPEVIRPLLRVPKTTLIDYAKRHKLVWRDDKTNEDEAHLRNYIRKHVLRKMTTSQRCEFLDNIDKVAKIGKTQNKLIATISQDISKNGQIDRSIFISLPTEVGNELLIFWLREAGYRSYDKKTIERLNTSLRTARAGTKHRVSGQVELVIGKSDAYFELKQ